ncbi:ATP-grasp domain-containing protein [Longispora urticae]
MPTVAVCYDLGAASPVDVLAASADLCRPVFLCDLGLPHVAANRRLIGSCGTLVDITGRSARSVADHLAEAGIRHLTTFSEGRLPFTAAVAASAGLEYHSVETARRCVDKAAQRAALAGAGVDTVRSATITRPDQLSGALAQVGVPAVLKPRVGVGSARTVAVDDAGHAAAVLAELGVVDGDLLTYPFVVEEMLLGDRSVAGPDWGDYLSVESVVRGDAVEHLFVTGRFPLCPPFRETGAVLPSTVPPEVQRSACQLAERAVRTLGIRHGVTHTEVKLTASGPRLIEVNGRLGGALSATVRRAAGFDVVRAALRNALGLPTGSVPLTFRRVAFQYFVQPPTDALHVAALAPPAAALNLPGVRRVDLRRGAGDPVDWRNGTDGHVAVLHGDADDHEAARSTVRAAVEALAVRYR